MSWSRLSIILFPLLLLVAYTNCGRVGFEANRTVSSAFSSQGKTLCDADLMQAYADTYFPLLSTNCNSCHAGAHGSTDVIVSYTGFMAKGSSLINYKASNPHGGNSVNLSNQVSSLSTTWNRAQDSYTSCMANLPVDGGGDGVTVALNAKVIPDINATLTNQGAWKPVSWDLETEVPAKYLGQFGTIFTIEARFSLYNGGIVGFEFRNPKMKLKRPSLAVQLHGMNLKIDDVAISGLNSYINIDAYVGTTTDVFIAPGASNGLAVAPVSVDSKVSFVFTRLEANVPATTTTTTVTTTTTMHVPEVINFSDLVGNTAPKNVFAARCFSCHSGATVSGGLDLSNYAMASSKSALIKTRSNSTTNPMPPAGLLPQSLRYIIQDWVDGGAKQ